MDIDEKTDKGNFEWKQIGNNKIPYFCRGEEKFVALKMFLQEGFIEHKYLLEHILENIYASFYFVRNFYVTEAEAHLLNQLNKDHYNNFYGQNPFNTTDRIIRLDDALEFRRLLCWCYAKSHKEKKDFKHYIGLFKINAKFLLPFVVINRIKQVPLYCFDRDAEILKPIATQLHKEDDLAYFKTCLKLQKKYKKMKRYGSSFLIELDHVKDLLGLTNNS